METIKIKEADIKAEKICCARCGNSDTRKLKFKQYFWICNDCDNTKNYNSLIQRYLRKETTREEEKELLDGCLKFINALMNFLREEQRLFNLQKGDFT